MIIIGTEITSEDTKVNGSFVDGSKVITIAATTFPISPIQVSGKSNELHLNTTTNELSWVSVDRPLTDSEQVTQLESQNAQMLMALVMGGLM